jgi:hypothetical protein
MADVDPASGAGAAAAIAISADGDDDAELLADVSRATSENFVVGQSEQAGAQLAAAPPVVVAGNAGTVAAGTVVTSAALSRCVVLALIELAR